MSIAAEIGDVKSGFSDGNLHKPKPPNLRYNTLETIAIHQRR